MLDVIIRIFLGPPSSPPPKAFKRRNNISVMPKNANEQNNVTENARFPALTLNVDPLVV